jgi:hypothetical protein
MTQPSRRTFMFQVVATSVALGASRAQAQSKLEESDPQAIALGYRQDTTKVDAKKYPAHVVAQDCATCQLFQGKPKDPSGACTLFAGKTVAAAGWCSAWTKKTG